MKKSTIASIISILLFTISSLGFAQKQYTPYDDFPGMIKSYKPSFNSSYPSWAQMLYQYPVNYFEVVKAYLQSSSGKEENAITRYFKLWQRNIEPWVADDGSIATPDMERYYQKLKDSQLAASANTPNPKSASNWSFLGPKETYLLSQSGSSTPAPARPWQVNIYSFDVSSSNNDILYGGTETGFVNKTTNGGDSWQLMARNYYFGGGITATAINPINPDIVYVAAGNQIHKTTDGGQIWAPMLETSALFSADRLAIDPQNPDKIIAAANNGVYVSDDAGDTWAHTYAHPTFDIQIMPNNSNKIYALSQLSGNFVMVYSDDGGQSFFIDNNFPTAITEQSGGLLAASMADATSIWVVMLSSNNTPYLYQGNTTDGSWTLLATGQTSEFPMDNGQGYFDLVLEVSPLDPNIIFAGTTTLFKSSNGGANFHAIGGYTGAYYIHPDIQDMKMLPSGDTWISTDGGMTLTTDNFSNTNNYIARVNGIVGSDMWGFDQAWNEDLVVGGRYHNGNTAIADYFGDKALQLGGGESPTGWVMKGKSRYVAFNDIGNGWILPTTAEGEAEGRFIFSKYPNMDEYGGRRSNVVFHPNYYGIVYEGEGNGFWKSEDMGISWDLLYDFTHHVRYFQVSYHQPLVMYADVVNMGLMRTDDGGLSWESKPSLTSGDYGTSYWKGKTFFVISPQDENVIYACLQNGTWTGDIGEVFRSADGGDTWEDWTGSLTEYTKDLVIQSDANGEDIVYLFTNARNGETAKVFKRSPGMSDWESFDNNYPAGNYVNLALPFYMDSKIRVSGMSGVWETSMAEENFLPIINMWVDKPVNNCMMDTLFFDDHSILNHQGVSWHWDINPEPEYIDNADIRNPKVVLGAPGSYDVSMSLVKDGVTYTKEIPTMVSTTTCPSIDDCFNPAELPKDSWELVYVDSEETNYPGLAIMSFDDDPSTIWHTRWSTGSDPYPHEIQVDMGQTYQTFSFSYLARQDGSNGRIKDYELYISDDLNDWGMPVSTGTWTNTSAPQIVNFDEPQIGRYFRLVALSEVNGNAWASAAEFSLVGCTDLTATSCLKRYENLKAFPVPTSGLAHISLPDENTYEYSILTSFGQILKTGVTAAHASDFTFDFSSYKTGFYIIQLQAKNGSIYRVKVVVE
jgi:photosystem II stability/assembly factor-like uncharacterized protein